MVTLRVNTFLLRQQLLCLAGVAPFLVFLPAARPMKQIRPCLCRLKLGARCGVKERADGK